MRASRSAYEEAKIALRRREAGVWLRQIREARGFTQRQLAERVGIEFYTFVSQIESGRGRIPADRYKKWADALEVNPKYFAKKMLHLYEPAIYQILFDSPEDIDIHNNESADFLVFSENILTLRP